MPSLPDEGINMVKSYSQTKRDVFSDSAEQV